MGDPHSEALEKAYAIAADHARRTVAAMYDLYRVGSAVLPDGVNRDRFRDVWRLEFHGGTPVPHLFVAIPWVFPDELPHIYAPYDLAFEGARIPHLDRFQHVCTFNISSRFPNPDRPGEAVLATISRALEIMNQGLTGQNKTEYMDEFDAYWGDVSRPPIAALAILRMEGVHRKIRQVLISPPLAGFSLLITDDDTTAHSFLDAIGRARGTPAPALFLQLDSTVDVRGILHNSDVARCLPSEPKKALFAFLKEDHRPSLVLFSIPIKTSYVFGGWMHRPYSTIIYRGERSRRHQGQAAGFLPGHLSPEVELTLKFATQPVDRVVVTRADPSRLDLRTSGEERDLSGEINVIGCGSVGGFIARALAYARPSTLRLVDNELLEVHNVPRHVCDLTSVGQNKAEAVGGLLRRSDPSLQIEPYPQDVLEILRTSATRLVPAKLTVVSLAKIAPERTINEVARGTDLGVAAYVWIEPHAIAGHAVIVPPKGRGCFECLVQPDGELGVGVLRNRDSFTLNDAGCRGSYIPYGGLDLEIFSTTIARHVLRALSLSACTQVTWIGDIEKARRNSWLLEPAWASAQNYSTHQKAIEPRSDCRVCADS